MKLPDLKRAVQHSLGDGHLGVGALYLLHLVQTGREAKTSLAIAHHHTRALTAAMEIAQVRAETQRQLYEAAWQQGQRR